VVVQVEALDRGPLALGGGVECFGDRGVNQLGRLTPVAGPKVSLSMAADALAR
jgi:hypothetical protein